MATRFQFRLIDGGAPEGELEADQLLAIVQSLKELATKVSRAETDGEPIGRPSSRTKRVARLTIGLGPGSTSVFVRRAVDASALAIELDEERAFDDRFRAVVESIAADARPAWVTDTLAIAAGKLRSALEDAAPTVEFTAGGQASTVFRTTDTHSETWNAVNVEPGAESVAFVGRLRAVNLDTHRLQVTDDAGNRVGLPNVVNDETAGRLLGGYVTVIGVPARDEKGRLTQIHEAVVEAASVRVSGVELGVPESVSLEEILARAPGPMLGAIRDLTDDEADGLLDALGL